MIDRPDQRALDRRPGGVVAAWTAQHPRDEIESVDVIKRKRWHHDEDKMPSVCRLRFAQRPARPIVAKLCSPASGALERRLYTEILPLLNIPHPLLIDWAQEPGGGRIWLFLEECVGEPYDVRNGRHRVELARWLGRLGAGFAGLQSIDRLPELPERGLVHYRSHLQDAVENLLSGRANRSLSADDRAMLDRLAATLGALDGEWDAIEELTEGIPVSLVHGDLVGKNIRVHFIGDAPHVCVFDWATAGVGVVAPDLWSAGLHQDAVAGDAYLAASSTEWIGDSDVMKAASVGQLMRLIASADWASESLIFHPVGEASRELGIYELQMNDVMEALGLR